jgi:Uma2 family endonuclease
MAVATRTSLEQFFALPSFDEQRLELIDGEVFEKPMPTWEHGRYALRLGAALDTVGVASVEPRAIIPASASFDASSPLPDVAFYRENPPAGGEWMTRPPNVAIEIMSPGQTRRDMRTKVELYLSFGVESVWIVDPRTRSVEVYEAGVRRVLAEADTISSRAAPGFAMAVSDLFQP